MLVAEVRQLDDNTHAVTVEWPGMHPYYLTDSHRYHPLLFVESVRQSLAVVSHVGLDVPPEYRMSWEFLASDVAAAALRVGTGPAAVELVVTHEPVTRRKLGSIRFSAHACAWRGGIPLGAARVNYTAYPPALYRRLRGRNADAAQAVARALPPPAPVAATIVGRTSQRDVALAPGTMPRQWQLRADTTHPVFFDHQHDHIPGMVLLEAACQAAQADAAPERLTPASITATFSRFVELDLPCWIVAEPACTDLWGRRRHTVHGVQQDKVVFTVATASEHASRRRTVPWPRPPCRRRAQRVPGGGTVTPASG